MKKLLAMILAAAMSISTVVFANYKDVPETADYSTAVEVLTALDIIEGYGDDTFKPENLITRAEASKMLVGTMGPAMMQAASASKGTKTFEDVPGEHWASGFIAQGASNGYINGVGNGYFDPETDVTFAQMVKMLVCVLGYEDDAIAAGGWPNGFINQGASLGITKGVSADANEKIDRGQVAQLIHNSLYIPIKGITGYAPGLSVDNKGNITSSSIPEKEIYNGKGDSGKYETLLTTYFDAYAVRGRIVDNNDKGKGTITYSIEFSENFDDEVGVYNGKKDKDGEIPTLEIDTYYPAHANVDSLLCSYTDAIVKENEDGDWEIISIVSYGKNEVASLSSDLYKDDTFVAGDTIEFYKSMSSSKTVDYDLDKDAIVYVNGTKIDNEDLVDYLNHPNTTVKLINTPKAGSKNIDSKYDYIMLSLYASAIVDDVIIEDDKATIYVDYFDENYLDADLEFDLDAMNDGEASYFIYDNKNKPALFEDIKAGDVITLYGDYSDPKYAFDEFATIYITNNVETGKVTEINNDTDRTEYCVNGNYYVYDEALKVGDSYTLYLDKFDRIVKAEIESSSINYGIINRVWEDDNGDYCVRLVNADGKVVSYAFNKADEYDEWVGVTDPAQLIVTYKLSSKDKIYNITTLPTTEITANYSERSNKIGVAKMSDLTTVLDYTKVTDWKASISDKVSVVTTDSFVDDEEYTVRYGGEKFTDGTYPFVLVTKGEASINTATRFAIVQSIGIAVNGIDGMTYASAVVLEGKEEKTLYFEDEADGIKKGSVLVYHENSDGLVDEFVKIFDAEDSIALTDIENTDKYIDKTNSDYKTELYYKKSGVASWDKLDRNDKYARVGFGALIDKTSVDITVGKVSNGVSAVYDDIDLASDVNVYVYDQGMKTNKASVGTIGSLIPTKIAKVHYEDDIYDWTAAGKTAVNTVFFKTFEDEITDIVIVKPVD